jgi:inosine-uridine nucleoside N-ribohydrolase
MVMFFRCFTRVFLLVSLVSWAIGTLRGFGQDSPVKLIFDTDMGNDCDDALALAMIHSLQSRGECQLLAVTITKDHELAAPFVDCVNTFYARGNIPIGVCRNSGKTPDAGKYNQVAKINDDGKLRFEHDLLSGNDAPTALEVLRRTLANAADASVVVVQVGFSTNLANLLASPADTIHPLSGRELFAKKSRGAYRSPRVQRC